MLFIVFKLRDDRYALDTSCVVEVVSLVDLKPLPNAAAGISGIFDYRGTPVPVIDLSVLASGRAAVARLSTRIIIVNYLDERDEAHVVGLIAEGATETMRREDGDFVTFGLGAGTAPFLGPVTRGTSGLIQRIDVRALLSVPIRALLLEAV
ncbi:MAG: chemotaxis protein CheW [Candidatus Eremiobacteraeota bacterium]|nr:chemotaxis protein CheW [Candidatus Eremiobacteraeota bacterium]